MKIKEIIDHIVIRTSHWEALDDDVTTATIKALRRLERLEKAGQALATMAKQQSERNKRLGFGRQKIDPYIDAWEKAMEEGK